MRAADPGAVNCGSAAAPRDGRALASTTRACAARCQPRDAPAPDRSPSLERGDGVGRRSARAQLIQREQRDVHVAIAGTASAASHESWSAARGLRSASSRAIGESSARPAVSAVEIGGRDLRRRDAAARITPRRICASGRAQRRPASRRPRRRPSSGLERGGGRGYRSPLRPSTGSRGAAAGRALRLPTIAASARSDELLEPCATASRRSRRGAPISTRSAPPPRPAPRSRATGGRARRGWLRGRRVGSIFRRAASGLDAASTTAAAGGGVNPEPEPCP